MINGFSIDLSWRLLSALNTDYVTFRKLLKELRRAKTPNAKKRVFRKYKVEKQQEIDRYKREIKKIQAEIDQLEKKRLFIKATPLQVDKFRLERLVGRANRHWAVMDELEEEVTGSSSGSGTF